jgi:isocitrate dehydrogenase (NAD+)
VNGEHGRRYIPGPFELLQERWENNRERISGPIAQSIGQEACDSDIPAIEYETIFLQACRDVAKSYQGITLEEMYVDNAAMQLIKRPYEFDVLVTTNMFGDILSDLAAEVVGGLGLAPSACIGDEHAYFEPVHGSAPKYAGKNMVNPTATILSAGMMLNYLGMNRAANSLEEAIKEMYREGKTLTYDQGGNATTTQFSNEVLKTLDKY